MIFSIEKEVEKLRKFRKERGIKRFFLATLAGVSESTLRGIDTPGWNPNLLTLKKLEQAVKRIIAGDIQITSSKSIIKKHEV